MVKGKAMLMGVVRLAMLTGFPSASTTCKLTAETACSTSTSTFVLRVSSLESTDRPCFRRLLVTEDWTLFDRALLAAVADEPEDDEDEDDDDDLDEDDDDLENREEVNTVMAGGVETGATTSTEPLLTPETTSIGMLTEAFFTTGDPLEVSVFAPSALASVLEELPPQFVAVRPQTVTVPSSVSTSADALLSDDSAANTELLTAVRTAASTCEGF